MNWIYNHKRALLHVNLAFIGGLTGAYAILVRGGNFGAAQTMNLIEMVLNFTEMNLTDAFLRLAIFILYGLAIIAAFLIFHFKCTCKNRHFYRILQVLRRLFGLFAANLRRIETKG